MHTTSLLMPMSDGPDWHWWFDAYEAHMAGYIPNRDQVMQLVHDVVIGMAGPTATIVELGSGTGSLAHRIAASLPAATLIAIDLDPVATAIGRHVFDDASGQLHRLELDLREPGWHDQLPEEVDVVVSIAALHMLGAARTGQVLHDVGGRLRTGGLLIDLDWAPPRAESPRLQQTLRTLANAHETTAAATAFSKHRDALQADPQLARLDVLRGQRLGHPSGPEPVPLTGDEHRAALHDAGFVEVVELWRHLDLALFAAVG
jgi:SAM-dependent methyltransferase